MKRGGIALLLCAAAFFAAWSLKGEASGKGGRVPSSPERNEDRSVSFFHEELRKSQLRLLEDPYDAAAIQEVVRLNDRAGAEMLGVMMMEPGFTGDDRIELAGLLAKELLSREPPQGGAKRVFFDRLPETAAAKVKLPEGYAPAGKEDEDPLRLFFPANTIRKRPTGEWQLELYAVTRKSSPLFELNWRGAGKMMPKPQEGMPGVRCWVVKGADGWRILNSVSVSCIDPNKIRRMQ